MRYGMNFHKQDEDLGFSILIPDPDVPSSPAGVGAYLICILLMNMQILCVYMVNIGLSIPHTEKHEITVLFTVTEHTGPHHGMELYHALLGSNSYR